MKRTYLKIVIACIALFATPLLAEQASEELALENDFRTLAPQMEQVEQDENQTAEPAQDFLAFGSTCLVSAPQCPTGSYDCAGKAPGSSCGNGGTCFGLCSTPFVGTVCSCFSFGTNADSNSEAAFLAELSSTQCQADESTAELR